MEAEIEDEGEQVMKIRLEDANPAVANSLRRAMSGLVPTLAVKHLDIVSNESALFDELLASRVGQVPFEIPGELDEDETVHVAAKAEGPDPLTAEDLKTDRDLEPVQDALIADLKEGQTVEFEAEAELGRGRDHAKHQGGTVGYEKTGDGEFVFRIESSSGYGNAELFEAAVQELQRQLEEFEDELDSL